MIKYIKIGDHIWIRKDNGYGFFEEIVVVGETTRSWVTIPVSKSERWQQQDGSCEEWYVQRYSYKLPKNLRGFITAEEDFAKLSNWAISERYHIAKAVERSIDPVILLAVSKLVGYKQPEGIE